MRKIFTLCFFMALVCVKGWGQSIPYSFGSSSGTYTALVAGATGVSTSSATGDDGTQNGISIGFTFPFAGTNYSYLSITTNGFIKLGTTSASSSITTGTPNYTNSIGAASNAPLIAPLWDDLNLSSGTILYQVSGSSPNRVLTINWQIIRWSGDGSTLFVPTNNFIVKLYETTGLIQLIYGTMNGSSGGSASIGITNTSGSYLSVTPASTATASSTTANDGISSATNLTSGTTYTFTPLPACTTPAAPGSISTGQTTTSTIPGTVSVPSPIPTGYMIISSTSNSLTAGPVNGSSYSVGSSIGGGTVQYYSTSNNFTASTSLTSNTKYYLFAYSYNSGCAGAPYFSSNSSSTVSTNATTIPSAPTAVTATAGNGQASVSFTAPSGTAAITQYTVTSNPGGITATGTSSSIVVPGLTNGTAYTFTVTATNVGGTSAASAASNSVTPQAPCVAPNPPTTATLLTLGATAPSTEVDVNYTAPTPPPTGYIIVRYAGASPTVTAPSNGTNYAVNGTLGTGTVIYNSTGTTYPNTGLTANTTYTYYVYDYNNTSCVGGPVYTTSPLSGTITTCLAAPTANAATLVTSNSFTANWSVSAGATSYLLDVATTNTFTAGTFVSGYNALSVSGTSQSVTGLTANTNYYYRVRAVGSAGCTSLNSLIITVTTLLTPCVAPNPPTATTLLTLGSTAPSTEVDVNYTAPTPAPTGYIIVRYAGSSPVVTAPSNGTTYAAGTALGTGTVVYSGTAITYANTGLTDNTTYTYYVYDYNNTSCSAGPIYTTSPLSGTVTTCVAAPTANTATSITSNSFTASWSTSPGATSYFLDVATTSAFTAGTFVTGYNNFNAGMATSQTITGLSPNTNYYYRVRAVGSAGCTSLNSVTITVTTLLTPCVAPNPPTATTLLTLGTAAPSTEVDITYTAPAPAPSGYIIVRYAGASPAVTAPSNGSTYAAGASLGAGTVVYSNTGTTYANTGLAANTTYTYYVYDYNNTSCSGGPVYTTSPLSGIITTCVGTPTANTATSITSNSFIANWSASTGATSYFLDVATTNTFTAGTFVSGYNGLSVSGTSQSVTGLTANTNYYYRVRAVGSAGCTSLNSSTITVTTLVPRAVGTIAATQQATGTITRSSTSNNILRISIPITGTSGTLTLNSVTVTSGNISDADITSSGVKLWSGNSSAPTTQLGAASFSGGTATFSGLNLSVSTAGTYYLWVTYDITSTATLGDQVDAQIAAGGIVITASGDATNPGTQPPLALNPAGNGTIGFIYCTPTYTNPLGSTPEAITNVTLAGATGTINNTSGTSNPSPYYRDYTSQQPSPIAIPTLHRSSSYTLSLTFGSDGDQYNGVWIDFNQNGTFETSEFFTSNTDAGSNGTASVTITVPAGAVLGNTRMRIRGGDDNQPLNTQACGASASNYGEAEDYTVNIIAACPAPTVTVAPASASICAGGSVSLTASGSTSYSWSPATGLSATTGATVIASPSVSTIYTVSGTAVAGCTNIATVSVQVSPQPTATVAATATTVCSKDTVTLTGTFAGKYAVGTGTVVNATNSFPSLFGDVNRGVKNQMLIPASELTAAGLTAGTLTEVAFDVVSSLSIRDSNYQITIGTTTLNTLPTAGSFATITNPVTVLNLLGSSYVPSGLTGYDNNTIVFQTPYIWNGTSNLIVQVCYNNFGNTPSGVNATFNQTTTSYVSTLIRATDGSGVCGNTSYTTGLVYNQRPNMRFTETLPDGTFTSYSWSNGANTVGTTNPVKVVPINTGTSPSIINYTVTATGPNVCTTTSSPVAITVNPLPAANISYNGSPYCGTGNAAVTRTGQAGGTYSSIVGLVINPTNGTVNLATSDPGTYDVVYSFTNGTCSNTDTTSITIYPQPVKLNFTSAGTQYYCTDADGSNGDGFDIAIDTSETGVHYELLLNGVVIADSAGHSGNGTEGSGSIDFGIQFATGTYRVRGTNTTTGCTQIVTNGNLVLSTKQRPQQFDVTVGGVVTTTASACQGNNLVFGLSASQSGATYRLYFNNTQVGGTIAGNVNGNPISFPPTAITASGTYKVTSVTGTCGTVTMNNQVAVTVLSRPTPTFVPASPSGSYCSSQNSIIYTTQSGQSNYVWSVPGTAGVDYNITAGGISSTDNTVTITWLTTSNTSSTKTITVNYDNSNGCNGLTAATSTITINPTPTIANKTTAAACNGLFSVTPTNGGGDIVPVGTTYSWSAPTTPGITGAASGANQSSVSGTLTNTTNSPITVVYNVTGTAGSCSSSFTVSVTVNPVPSITAKTTTAACNGAFTVTPTNGGSDLVPTGTTYSWSVPTGTGFTGGAAGSGSAITGTLTNTTDATVTAVYTVTPTSGTCTGSTFTVTVSVKAVSNISNQTTTVCSGSLFTVTPATGGVNIVPAGTTYSWGVPTMSAGVSGGVAGGGNSISGMLTYSGATTGTAIYTVTPVSGSGCTGNNSFTVTVTINALPVAVVSADNPYACAGSGGSFTITGTPNSTVSYNLNGGSGTSKTLDGSGNGTVPVGFISSSVTITLTSVSASAATGGCSSTPAGAGSTATITTAPLPAVYNLTGGGNYCPGGTGVPVGLDGSQSGVSYQLLVDNGTTTSPAGSPAAGNGGVLTFGNQTTVGTYSVQATNTTTGCVKTGGGTTVMVGQYTPATITADATPATQTVCQNGTPMDLTVTAVGNNLVYQWYSNTTSSTTGGTAITNTNSSSYTPVTTAPGTLYYYVTVSGPCRTVISRIDTVTVSALPAASFTASSYSACGSAVAIGVSGTNGAIVNYSYTGTATGSGSVTLTGGSATTDGTGTINSPGSPGTYNYTVTSITNGCTGSSGSTTTATIDPAPSITLSSAAGTDNQSICKSGQITTITYSVTSGGTPTVTGLPAGVTSSYGNGVFTIGTPTGNTPTVTGVYPYTITVPGGACGTPVTISGVITASVSWNPIGQSVDWNTGSNWCSGSIPMPADYVTIPANKPSPVLSGDVEIGSLDLAATRTVSIGSYTLQVNGAVSGAGTLTGSATSNLTTGGTGTVNFTPTAGSNVLRNLAVNGGTLTLGNALNITAGTAAGVVTVSGAGQLATAGNLTLKSDKNGTASVAAHAGTTHIADYITGNVTAERYTDGGITTGKRAWRLVTSPVTDQTISQAWQEGLVYDATAGPNSQPSTYGTIITGEKLSPGTAGSLGFDYVGGGNNASIKRYDAATNAWVPLPNTNSTLVRGAGAEQAYMLFIRGDRTQSTPAAKGPDNLHPTGTLLQGPQTVTVPSGNTFTVVGNPYAAPLDFARLHTANASVIQDQFYAWDTHLSNFGGYVTVSGNNGVYTATPSPLGQTGTVSVTQYIQSGQGFLVVPDNGGGTLTIGESMKNTAASTATSASPFRVVPAKMKQIRVNLNLKGDTSATLADGFLAKFDDYYSDIAAQQEGSSRKAWNFNENLNLVWGGKAHIIEARADVQKTDTLFMQMWNVTRRSYQLQMKADNFTSAPGVHAWLVDSYLGTKQELSLSGSITTVDFAVNSDSLSSKTSRFMIVFQNNAVVLPVTLTSVKAAPANGGVNVSWTVTNEVNIKGYTVERSADGGRTYTAIATQTAKNATAASVTGYTSFDNVPKAGENLYRIRIEAKDGTVTYSGVVKITIGEGDGSIQIAVYPNPVRDGKVSLQLSNLAAGTYLAGVYSEGGQTVYQKKITISQSNTTQSEELRLGKALAQGSYQLRLTDNKGITLKVTKLIVAY